jgi:hypothetical protein
VAPPTTDTEVFLDAKQITGNGVDEGELEIDGPRVVWSGPGGNDLGPDTEVFQWDESLDALIQVNGSNSVPDGQPQISGDRVVWVSGTGNAAEIWRYDASAVLTLLQVTNDGVADGNPQLDGDVVVWETDDGNDLEIVLHVEGGIPQPLTDNTLDDHSPRVSGSNVVWVREEAGDSEIWACFGCTSAGAAAQKVTDDGLDDRAPRIDGERITWEKCRNTGLPSEECEIMLAPEPSAGVLGLAALAAGCALAGRRGPARRAP